VITFETAEYTTHEVVVHHISVQPACPLWPKRWWWSIPDG